MTECNFPSLKTHRNWNDTLSISAFFIQHFQTVFKCTSQDGQEQLIYWIINVIALCIVIFKSSAICLFHFTSFTVVVGNNQQLKHRMLGEILF